MSSVTQESINRDRLYDSLSRAIQIPTVSYEDETLTDWSQFEKLHDLLKECYPKTFETLEVTDISKASLLLYWKGTDETLDPIGFCAHQDVVPVPEATLPDWKYEPYSGHNDGEFIYGRGAIDMKNHLLSLFEAVESLLEEGFTPKRSIYLLLGHNEEIVSGSSNGAEAITQELIRRGIHFDSIVDEGGAIVPVKVPHLLDTDIAAIGIAEKGYADIRVTVEGKGGHSSRPPKHSAVGDLAKRIQNLERHPFQASMPDYLAPLVQSIGEQMTKPGRFAVKHFNLKNPLVLLLMKQIPVTAALVQTTQCVTMAEGAPAGNIMPEKASAVINCRMIQGTTLQDAVDHVEKYMGGDHVTVELIKGKEASAVSSTDTRSYRTLSSLLKEENGKIILAPYLDMGGTDCYHYEPVCDTIYRFAPYKLTSEIIGTTHGTNERIPLDVFAEGTQFFKAYMRAMTK